MTAIVSWSDKTVEFLVIHLCQPVLELAALSLQPVHEAVTDFVNLRVCQLDGLSVRSLDVVPVLVLTDFLHNLGSSVVQGVTKEGHTVIGAVIAFYHELAPYLCILLAATGIELVYLRRIDDVHVRPEEVGHECRIGLGGNPSLTEVKIQFFEGDGCWHGLLQGVQRLHDTVVHLSAIVLYHLFDGLHLLHHVSSNELVAYLIIVRQWIVEYLPFQFADNVILRLVRQA